MKTLFLTVIAAAIPISIAVAEGPVETAKEVAHDTADTAKNVGHSIAKGTKKAVNTVKDAVTPDPDAHQANVTLTDDRIDMPTRLKSGKTAFIVKNSGKQGHNFEVRGNGTDQKFMLDVAPNSTKVLHVHLEHGTYAVLCPEDGHKHKGMETTITVR